MRSIKLKQMTIGNCIDVYELNGYTVVIEAGYVTKIVRDPNFT